MGAESILVKPEIRIYGSTMFGAESEMSLTESTVIIELYPAGVARGRIGMLAPARRTFTYDI